MTTNPHKLFKHFPKFEMSTVKEREILEHLKYLEKVGNKKRNRVIITSLTISLSSIALIIFALVNYFPTALSSLSNEPTFSTVHFNKPIVYIESADMLSVTEDEFNKLPLASSKSNYELKNIKKLSINIDVLDRERYTDLKIRVNHLTTSLGDRFLNGKLEHSQIKTLPIKREIIFDSEGLSENDIRNNLLSRVTVEVSWKEEGQSKNENLSLKDLLHVFPEQKYIIRSGMTKKEALILLGKSYSSDVNISNGNEYWKYSLNNDVQRLTKKNSLLLQPINSNITLEWKDDKAVSGMVETSWSDGITNIENIFMYSGDSRSQYHLMLPIELAWLYKNYSEKYSDIILESVDPYDLFRMYIHSIQQDDKVSEFALYFKGDTFYGVLTKDNFEHYREKHIQEYKTLIKLLNEELETIKLQKHSFYDAVQNQDTDALNVLLTFNNAQTWQFTIIKNKEGIWKVYYPWYLG